MAQVSVAAGFISTLPIADTLTGMVDAALALADRLHVDICHLELFQFAPAIDFFRWKIVGPSARPAGPCADSRQDRDRTARASGGRSPGGTTAAVWGAARSSARLRFDARDRLLEARHGGCGRADIDGGLQRKHAAGGAGGDKKQQRAAAGEAGQPVHRTRDGWAGGDRSPSGGSELCTKSARNSRTSGDAEV